MKAFIAFLLILTTDVALSDTIASDNKTQSTISAVKLDFNVTSERSVDDHLLDVAHDSPTTTESPTTTSTTTTTTTEDPNQLLIPPATVEAQIEKLNITTPKNKYASKIQAAM